MTGKLLRAALKAVLGLVEAGYIEPIAGRAEIVPALLARRHGFRAKTLKRYLDELVAAGLAEKRIEERNGNEYAVYVVDVERVSRLASTLSGSTSKPLPLVDAESLAKAVSEKLSGSLADEIAEKVSEKISIELNKLLQRELRELLHGYEEPQKLRREAEKLRKELEKLREENKRLRKENQELREKLEETRRLLEEEREKQREPCPQPALAGPGALALAQKLQVLAERNAELERMVAELQARIRKLEREKRELQARLEGRMGGGEEAEILA